MQGDPVPRGDHCPGCERFIGPADVCPYCDADSARSPVLRRLRFLALVLAIFGLGLLYAAAQHREPPDLAIGDLQPTMNFAHVRVEGCVERAPFVAREGGAVSYISFALSDGTGLLRVRLGGGTLAAMPEGEALPAAGDRVRVTGRLDLKAGRDPALQARAVERVGRLGSPAVLGGRGVP